MTKIITVAIAAPLWRAGRVRDALAPTLVRSAELTVGESWSWRTPLRWRFTLTGPAFQVHKAAGDARPLGTVHYAKYVLAGALGVAALVAVPVGRCALAYDDDRGRDVSAGGSGSGTGIGSKVDLSDWKAKNRALFEKNNTWVPANNWFTRLLDRIPSLAPSQPVARYTDVYGPRGGIVSGSTNVGFHVDPAGRLRGRI